MHQRLWSWRRGESGASFDEIMESVRQVLEELTKPLVEELVAEAGVDEVDERCPECGGERKTRRSGGKAKLFIMPFPPGPWSGV